MNAIRNRLDKHFDSPPATKPALPKSERGRGQLWSDVVFDAVVALHTQLASRSEAVVAAAANSILELERTRMRHGQTVAGSSLDSEAERDFEDARGGVVAADGDDDPDENDLRDLPDLAEDEPHRDYLPDDRHKHPAHFRRHAEEAFEELVEAEAELPERERSPVTMERAMRYVEVQFEAWNLRTIDIRPGEFRKVIDAKFAGQSRVLGPTSSSLPASSCTPRRSRCSSSWTDSCRLSSAC